MIASIKENSAAPFVPQTADLKKLASAARACKGCELYKNATQTVFGEGPRDAKIVMLGEQPGDQEDREGKPFVGPSGKLLDRALADAGVDRGTVYISNAVKHFRFIMKSGRRFHQKPGAVHIRACRPWLEAEFNAIKPEVIVCLGSTAAQAVLRRAVTITSLRGKILQHPPARALIITVHPSSLLRAEDEQSRRAAYHGFVENLKLIDRALSR